MRKSKLKTAEQPPPTQDNQIPVVGIGASAGGLDAFKKLLGAIPADSGMAYILVQHLNPNYESMLQEILQKVTPLPVLELTELIAFMPNHIYILPGNKVLSVRDGRLELSSRQAERRDNNLPIDLCFSALAEVHHTHAIGVVLSGTANDGTRGLRAIKELGGVTFAQDETTAAYEGMPHSAMLAGVVDFILPPEEIPQKIMQLTRITDGNGSNVNKTQKANEEAFKHILSLLHHHKGIDFTYYKQTTIRRRILRRMALSNVDEPTAYLNLLREHKSEKDILYQDLLIPVTSFFRDSRSFENIKQIVFPAILKNKTNGEPIRAWVAGCSTGAEAYSLAMSIYEFIGTGAERVQIFASDISEPAIAKARSGFYTKNELEELSTEQIKEFFTKSNSGYQLKKEIRDMCMFAVHNFLKDPPFGKMDLISCRNVLIYMEPYLQKKALTSFHYALNPRGYLWLGKSETTNAVPDLYSADVKNDKIYTRKDVTDRHIQMSTLRTGRHLDTFPTHSKFPETTGRNNFQKVADDIILTTYAPAGVVVNDAMDIVHFRGNTAKYLEQSQGKPSHNLLKMAKPGLAFELRNILHKAKKEKTTITKENFPIQAKDTLSTIAIEAIPLPNTIEPHYLILFHEEPALKETSADENRLPESQSRKKGADLQVEHLERELAQAREDMRSITEDQEAANEELQSANEELLSSSEELQTLNEELETGKEELQSTNEELIVLNQELISSNELLTHARDFAENIIRTIRHPLLVLDKNLRVKNANSSFYKTFETNELETEGKLIYDLGNRQWNIPQFRSLLEEILPLKSSISDLEVSSTFPRIGERIMLLNARELKSNNGDERLILIAIEDITEKNQAIREIEERENRISTIFEAAPDAIISLDYDGHIINWNMKAEKIFGWTKSEIAGRTITQTIIPGYDHEMLIKEYKEFVKTGESNMLYKSIEMGAIRKDGHKLPIELKLSVSSTPGKLIVFIAFLRDITNRKNNEAQLKSRAEQIMEKNRELQKMNKELEAFTYISSHDLQEPLRKIQTYAGRILEKEHEQLSESGKDMFNRMREASRRMQTLIQELLAFSRISAAERKFEPTNFNELLEEVKEEFKEVIKEKKVTIEMTELCEVKAIRFQLRQLLHNLIGNSIKFSKPDTPLRILIKSEMAKGADLPNPMLPANKEFCHITIIDNGIGFDNQFSNKIFEVFQKLHGKEEYPGTGIGLAVVKKIIENHEGFITASSELGKGARFDIYIPVL